MINIVKKSLLVLVALAVSSTLALGQANLFGRGAVTQASSATTAVTLDKPSGVITTVSLTNAAGVTTAFTVNNATVTATSVVHATIENYSGTIATNGIPTCTVNAIADGSFVVRVTNLGAANALSGIVKVGFTVIN